MTNVTGGTPTAPARRPGRRWRLLLFCLSPGLLLLAGAAGTWRYLAAFPPPPPVDTSDVEPAVAAAIDEARAHVRHRPWSGAAWGRLSMVLFAHHFEAEAQACLAQAQRLDPQDPRWPYLSARQVQLRDPEAALPLLRRAAGLARDTNVPRLQLADTLLELGHTAEAAAEYRRVLESAPNNPAELGRVHLGLGRLAYQQDDLDTSLAQLRAACVPGLNAKAAHVLLAEIHHRRGETREEARELALVPEGPDPVWPDPYMEEMAELQAGSEARAHRVTKLLREGQTREAEEILVEAVRDYPEAANLRVMLGGVLVTRGDLTEAEPQLRKALQLRPDSIDALGLMGGLLMRQRKHRAAADCYQRMISVKPGHALAHFNLAICRQELGDRDGAVGALRTALRCKPEFAQAHMALGNLLAEMGRDGEAAEHLEDALRLAPGNAQAKELLERVRARTRHPGKEKGK
jgi:tetratricopeptide (TPR) repeat protein